MDLGAGNPMTMTIWSWTVIGLGLFCWCGQLVSAIFPEIANRWGLLESKTAVDSTFYLDQHAEAIWDSVCLWTLPAAGLLWLSGSNWWIITGLIGGAIYLYFSGRSIIARLIMREHGVRVGSQKMVIIYYVALSLWSAIGVLTIVIAGLAAANLFTTPSH